MARDAQCTEILAELKAMFPDAWLSEAARASGWMRRLRKVSPAAMFWTLVCGFGSGRDRTISSLRRALEQQLGITLEESSFYDRFTPGLVKFLRLAVARGMEQVRAMVESMDRTRAGFFKDIVNIDSTVLRLHDALARRMPGTRTNHSPASAKVHLVQSVIGREARGRMWPTPMAASSTRQRSISWGRSHRARTTSLSTSAIRRRCSSTIVASSE